MRSRVKTTVATILLSMIVATGAMAHPDAAEKKGMDPKLAMRNFEYSLQWKEIPGIVESTIYNVVIFKSRFPGLDYAHLETLLQRVSKESNDPSIGYKAELAYMYLNYSLEIDTASQTGPADHESVFKQISEQLEKKFLVSQVIE